MTTNAISKKPQNALAQFKDEIEQYGEHFSQLMSPGVNPNAFIHTVITAVSEEPRLLHANRRTLWNACKKAAISGLVPDGREAALTTFKTNIGTKKNPKYIDAVQFMPMIEGIAAKVMESPHVKMFAMKAVYAGDRFTMHTDESGDHFRHEPEFDASKRGSLRLVYAYAILSSGLVMFDHMGPSDVESIRSRSRQGNTGPWADEYGYIRMALKSVGHRLAKRLPIRKDAAAAIHAEEDSYHDGRPLSLGDAFSAEPDEPIKKVEAIVTSVSRGTPPESEEIEPPPVAEDGLSDFEETEVPL